MERAPRSRVLVVEDDASARDALERLLADRFVVSATETAEEAERLLVTFDPDVVLTDIRLPGASGLTLLPKVLERNPSCVVIVMTAFSSVDTAVEAMRLGARDYIVKPINFEALEVVLDRELSYQSLLREVERLRNLEGSNVYAASANMREVLNTADAVADSMANVLIVGESGTGKEVVARYIHDRSGRSPGPFVAVNCGAIPEGLLETEFFGHDRGAFTGATEDHVGRFERANGGTIFLDEVGELPLNLQVKLLRVLQERTIEHVGGNEPIPVDVRVLAATNRNLSELMAQGRFRDDLYYRLNVFELEIPPLRDRPDDIVGLWTRFLDRVAQREGVSVPETEREVFECLHTHDWPGNVRELENVAERAVILSRGDTVRAMHLPASLRKIRKTEAPGEELVGNTLKDIEKTAILKTLAAVEGDKVRAAELLGISVRKIQYRLREWREAAEKES